MGKECESCSATILRDFTISGSLLDAPTSPQQAHNPPSLPDARPVSDRFRRRGRESNFLTVVE